MTKTFATCSVCKKRKFLNFTGLCKRCNNDKKGLLIREKAFEKREANLEQSSKANPAMDELQHLWELANPNEHQQKRITELESELGVKKPEKEEATTETEKKSA